MNKYIQKLDEEMDLRGFSENTKYSYPQSMRLLLKFHKTKYPERIDLDQIKDFLLNVKKYNGDNLSVNTMNRHVTAIRFFYKVVLNRSGYGEHLPRKKSVRRLPVYFSQQEIQKMIENLKNIKFKAIFMTLYSTGMRLGELRSLKFSDIDSKRMVIRIQQGKGGKDREALLSDHLLKVLRQYWKENTDDKSLFLFVGSKNTANPTDLGKKKLSHTAVDYIVKSAAKAAGIKKKLLLTY